MKQSITATCCGILFGLGLSLSHMVNPSKILNFLDITGDWDASLLFVMLGAIPVTLLAFPFIQKRPTPLLVDRFYLAAQSAIDRKLVIGASLFGIGWGMAGYCPGPIVASLGSLAIEPFIVLLSILAGFWFYHHWLE
jgi:uncharacterized protein